VASSQGKQPATSSGNTNDATALSSQIGVQGDLVRSLKAAKADKAKVDEAVKGLLDLKAKYKAATGQVDIHLFDIKTHPIFYDCFFIIV
jgi:bifunctional glutamyl/prolyl-tRNA synthetase